MAKVTAKCKPPRVYVRRVRLNQGGYTASGQYFGVGQPLYEYETADGEVDGVLRARDRKSAVAEAKRIVAKKACKGFKGLGNTRGSRRTPESRWNPNDYGVPKSRAGSGFVCATGVSDMGIRTTRCFKNKEAAERWIRQGTRAARFVEGGLSGLGAKKRKRKLTKKRRA